MTSDLVLVESKSARDDRMANVTHERALEVLNKAKALIMAVWQGTGTATTEQIAEYYGVSVETVKKILARSRDEFESDGLREIKGKDLKSFASLGSDREYPTISEGVTRLNIWTPRAALRLGMLLRDSAVAKQVRTQILNAIEVIPQQQAEIEKLRLQLELAQTRAQPRPNK